MVWSPEYAAVDRTPGHDDCTNHRRRDRYLPLRYHRHFQVVASRPVRVKPVPPSNGLPLAFHSTPASPRGQTICHHEYPGCFIAILPRNTSNDTIATLPGCLNGAVALKSAPGLSLRYRKCHKLVMETRIYIYRWTR
jgi:hypothetical protein